MDLERTQVQSPEERVKSQDQSLRRMQPPAKVPGYDPEHLLGEGAYGEVWVATERNTGRKVAVKFYTRRGGMDWSLLKREVEKLALMSADRYVMQLIEVGWDSDPPYYVMEYLGHGSLEERLAEEGTLPVDEAITLFREVATGLNHAHGKGVMHCDLKPANVLLDQDSKPRLCDFGQARLSDDQTPSLGTLFYMAPEQADLKDAIPDAQWDVYALGALLYCMLTGGPPYRSDEHLAKLEAAEDLEDRLAVYRALIENAPRPVDHRKVPGVNRDLAEIIDRCLAPQPAKRYSNVQAVLNDLNDWGRRKARRPLLWAVTVIPSLLIAVGFIFALMGFNAAVGTSGRELTDSTDKLLRTMALFAAPAIENKINARWGSLVKEAQDISKARAVGTAKNGSKPPKIDLDAKGQAPPVIREAIANLKRLLGEDLVQASLKQHAEFATNVHALGALLADLSKRRGTQPPPGGGKEKTGTAIVHRDIAFVLAPIVFDGARGAVNDLSDATTLMPLLAELQQQLGKLPAANQAIGEIRDRFREVLKTPPGRQRENKDGKKEEYVEYYKRYWDRSPDEVHDRYLAHLDVLDDLSSRLSTMVGEQPGDDEQKRQRLESLRARIKATRWLETLDAARWWTIAHTAEELERQGDLPSELKHDAIEERKDTIKKAYTERLVEEPRLMWRFADTIDSQDRKSQVIEALDGWSWVPRWLEIIKASHDPQAPSASWFMNNAQGYQLARAPMDVYTLFDNWSFRDYFHGDKTNRKRKADDQRVASPITQPHLSQTFDSRSTGEPIVAFSAPLQEKDGAPLKGILAMTVEFGQFSELKHGNKDVVTALVDSREGAQQVKDARQVKGVLLEHPYLNYLQRNAKAGETNERKKYLLAQEHLEVVENLTRSADPAGSDRPLTPEEMRTQLSTFIEKYQDPVADDAAEYGGLWRAALRAVTVRNRHTGWVVIVQTRQETVEAPVNKLNRELKTQALYAGLFVLLVLSAAWGFMLLTLQGHTSSKLVRALRRRIGLGTGSGTGTGGSATGGGRSMRRTSRLSQRARDSAGQ